MICEGIISVIVPVYNNELSVRRCLDSILSQSFANLEILLIDDGSTDNSGIIIEEYATKDDRVRILHKENGGLSSTRNRGLDIATGEFIAFVDADDWIEPDTFATALQHIGDSEICIFGRSVDKPGRMRIWRPTDHIETICGDEALDRLLLSSSLGSASWDKLYRSTLFTGIRFPDGFNYEDITITYRLFQKAKSITLIPSVLYHYVQYQNSIVHTPSLKNRLDHWSAIYELYRVFGDKGDNYHTSRVTKCIHSGFNAWGCLWKASDLEIGVEKDRIEEIRKFAREHFREILLGMQYQIRTKIMTAFIRIGRRWSYMCAYMINTIPQRLRSEPLY